MRARTLLKLVEQLRASAAAVTYHVPLLLLTALSIHNRGRTPTPTTTAVNGNELVDAHQQKRV